MSKILFFLFLIFNFYCYTYVMRKGKPEATTTLCEGKGTKNNRKFQNIE